MSREPFSATGRSAGQGSPAPGYGNTQLLDLAAPGYGKTQVMDLGQLGVLCALGRSEPEPRENKPEPWSVKTPVFRCIDVGGKPSTEPPAGAGEVRSAPQAPFQSTLCDGGALRDLAAQIVDSHQRAAGAPPAAELETGSTEGEAREESPEPSPSAPALIARAPIARRLTASIAAGWTNTSRVKRATAALLPMLALLAFMPRTPAASRAALSPKPASSTRAPTLASRSAPDGTQDAPSRAPAESERPAASGQEPHARTEHPLERRALQRALEGNLPEAASAYAELAQSGPRARLFEVAARASQSGAVRKP